MCASAVRTKRCGTHATAMQVSLVLLAGQLLRRCLLLLRRRRLLL